MRTDPAPAISRQELFQLVDALPESQREVIWMLKVSGMSLEEVARATASTVGAVKQKAHRAYEGAPPHVARASMNCRQVQALLEHRFARGGGPLPDDAALHLNKCERCCSFREFLKGARSCPAWHPSDCIHQRIRTTILQSLEAVSPLPPEWKLLAGLIGKSFLLPGLSVAVLGGGGIHRTPGWQMLGVVGLIGSSIAFASKSLVRQLVPGSYEKVSPAVLIALALAALTAGMIVLFLWKDTRMFAARGIPCLGKGLLVTMPAAALLYILARRGAVLARALAGATGGLLAGIVGLAVLQLNCTLLEATHIAVWHIGVVIASTSLGFVLGKVGHFGSRTSF